MSSGEPRIVFAIHTILAKLNCSGIRLLIFTLGIKKASKTVKRIHPSFIGKRTDRVDSSPVIPQLTLPDGSPFPLPSLLDFDPEYVKLKMTSNANRFQENYENVSPERSKVRPK